MRKGKKDVVDAVDVRKLWLLRNQATITGDDLNFTYEIPMLIRGYLWQDRNGRTTNQLVNVGGYDHGRAYRLFVSNKKERTTSYEITRLIGDIFIIVLKIIDNYNATKLVG